MTRQSLQNRVERILTSAGIVPDLVDSYGPLVSVKFRAETIEQPAKLMAWRILETLPDSEVLDYFKATGLDGNEYLTVRFTPNRLPKLGQVRPVVQSQPVAKPEPAAKPQPATSTPAPQRPVAQQNGRPQPAAKSAVERRNHYLANGLIPVAGQIAYTTVLKADGSKLKQARCEITAVAGDQVRVRLTKTGAELTVPLTNLFDHVPHLINGVWQ